jgi:hypothetical protein
MDTEAELKRLVKEAGWKKESLIFLLLKDHSTTSFHLKGKWWFFGESLAHVYGPYDTEEESIASAVKLNKFVWDQTFRELELRKVAENGEHRQGDTEKNGG